MLLILLLRTTATFSLFAIAMWCKDFTKKRSDSHEEAVLPSKIFFDWSNFWSFLRSFSRLIFTRYFTIQTTMNTQATGPQGTDNTGKEHVEFIFLAKIDNARVISSILQTLNTKKDQVRIIKNILMNFNNYFRNLACHRNDFKTWN